MYVCMERIFHMFIGCLGNQSNIAGLVEAMGWHRVWQGSSSRDKQEEGRRSKKASQEGMDRIQRPRDPLHYGCE